jgi:hypothetical protein
MHDGEENHLQGIIIRMHDAFCLEMGYKTLIQSSLNEKIPWNDTTESILDMKCAHVSIDQILCLLGKHAINVKRLYIKKFKKSEHSHECILHQPPNMNEHQIY